MDFCVFHWGLCASVTGWLGDTEMREEGRREERSLVTVMAGVKTKVWSQSRVGVGLMRCPDQSLGNKWFRYGTRV